MWNRSSLALSVCDLALENPFLLASAPPTARIESIRKAFSLGWAGAVLKTISSAPEEIQDVSPRFGVLSDGGKRIIGFENFELISRQSLEYWTEGIRALKRDFPQKIVIASVMAPYEREAWQRLVRDLQKAPVDAFELNFSCPHGMPETGQGMAIGTSAEISSEITRWVKEAAVVPVFVKLTPNVTDIASIAQAVQRSGADGLTAINTVQSLIGIDLDTLSPLPSVEGFSAYGGYSGKAVKPIGLRCVAQAKNATRLPVLAAGGISSWRDAVEYMAVGGNAVQVCTEVMLNGYAVIEGMLAGLSGYLEEKKMDSVQALQGAALPKLVTHAGLSRRKAAACIDAVACRSCGTCLLLCDESGYGAVVQTEEGYSIASSLCDGCGLCAAACPHHAISLR